MKLKMPSPLSRHYYIVTRGFWDDESNEPPTLGSYIVRTQVIDIRGVDSPEKVPAHLGESAWWYEEGTNHRVKDGHIGRDMGWEDSWVTKIEDLHAFVRQYGQCIINIGLDGYARIVIDN